MPPTVIVFDVNETLSDLGPLRSRFTDAGVPGHLAAAWFAAVLRDGFALAAAGGSAAFATIGAGLLRPLLRAERDGAERAGQEGEVDEAVDYILAGFGQLPVHPDVAAGVRSLRAAGYRLVTLSNGAVQVAEQLLDAAGLRSEFDQLLSVTGAGIWKPAAGAYEYAARACAAAPEQLLLVAAHPWDIDGASRAGLGTAWLNRAGDTYPSYFRPPGHLIGALPELADQLGPAVPAR